MARRRSPVRRLASRRLPSRRLLAAALVLLVVVLLRLADQFAPIAPPDSLQPGMHQVERVVDGDTLLLVGGARVRLIGADTPETVKPDHQVEPFGPEATAFTEQFVAEGFGQVRLEFDGPRKDKYDRFLATVWVGDRMLNEELLRAGLARLRDNYRFSPPLKVRLQIAYQAAKLAQRGLHGPLPSPAPQQ